MSDENPDCPICGTIMCWADLTIDSDLGFRASAIHGTSAQHARLLVCGGDDSDCPNGWDATQGRLRWY